MEKLYDAGKVRAIGVSNFSTKKLEDLIAVARVRPAVNQVECHPGWQQTKLHSFCQSAGVHLTVSRITLSVKVLHGLLFLENFLHLLYCICILQAYSSLGSPGTTWVERIVLEDRTLNSIAKQLGKTPAQVALRWNIQMGHSVLPKTVREERMKQNLDVFGWSIPDDLIEKISKIEQVNLFDDLD
jgi:alcohol dehydrogenase (NADP+)